jgi:hypothetical protein
MYSKKIQMILVFLSITCITIYLLRCENDKGIEFKVLLVNPDGIEINRFQLNENVRFEFYLINRNNYSVSYKEPSCRPFSNFLKVYQKSTDEYGNTNYLFIGNPEIVCATQSHGEGLIEPDETKWIGTIPITNEYYWPPFVPDDYYVGDIFEIVIDGEKTELRDKIYFTIY